MFTWDTQKALLNFEKHQVSFEEALTVFGDPNGFEVEDLKHSTVERRFKRIGRSSLGRVLHVVFTVRKLKNGKETVRIISARQASWKERQVHARS